MLVKPPRSVLDGFEIVKCSVGRFPDGSGRRRITEALAGPAFFLIAAARRLRERGISCDRKRGRPAAMVTGVFVDFLRQLAEFGARALA